MSARRWLPCVVWSVIAVACQSARPDDRIEHEHTLVYLRTGSRDDLGAEERQSVFAGHFANMERLARAGALLVAGPFGRMRSDPALRGIFVLASGDRDEARQLAETDPGYRAGVFALEYHTLQTAAPLDEIRRRDLAELDLARAAGRTPAPGENGRGYVLLIAEDGSAAVAALRNQPITLLLARLDGRRAWAILDALDMQAAELALAPLRSALPDYRLEEWFATRGLEQFARTGH